MSMFFVGQIIGFIAVVFSLIEYQVNDRGKMLYFAGVAALLYSLSFYLIHAYTGAILNLIGAVRCYTFIRSKNLKDSLLVFSVFGLASGVSTLLTWAGPLSLLALFGTLFSATSSGQLNTRLMRRAGLLAPPLWFSYNLISKSYPGMFIEVFVIASNLIGQYRFDFKKSSSKINSSSDL